MTRSAREFVTPLTFAALSGREVITDLFGNANGAAPNLESAIQHIAVAQSIDALVIAPATANILAKMAQGIADDFLSTLFVATKAPVLVAPAMNVNMWENAATQKNLEILRERGVRVLEPDEGYLACGMTGAGRLTSVESIVREVLGVLGFRDDLREETVLVTAGPTEEPLDAVRFLGNRSSGKMGYALAEAAHRRGARVFLVSGPTHLEPPSGVMVERVRTAEEMAVAVGRLAKEANIIVMAAAVADFRPAEFHSQKIKKQNGAPEIKLEPTRDILAEIAKSRRPDQVIVGFAAETEHVIENAEAKLRSKRLDLMVANDVSEDGAGFEVDTNIVTLIFPDGRIEKLQKMSKLDVARRVLDEVVEIKKAAIPSNLTNSKL
jgi:phosphopantothenoylcysteine decarboxylase/phosphopantothenate--cysteine ligase